MIGVIMDMRMRPMGNVNDMYRIPKPKKLSQVPNYLKELISTFTKRLFYIFRLVWETKKSLLFVMLLMSVFNGVMPVIGSLIGAKILNDLAAVYSGAQMAFSVISVLLIYQFAYMFLNSAVSSIYGMFTSICGEQVAAHVKLKIIKKAKTIDMVSYDSPEFYSKLENASREASFRPVQIINATFLVLSTFISIFSYIAVLFTVSAWAPLLIIIVSIPTTIINFVYRKKNVNYMFFRSKNRRQMEYYANTVINKDLVKEVRMYGLGDTFCDRYKRTFDEYFKGLKKLQLEECFWNVGATVLTNVVYCFLYIFLARGVYRGAFAVGDFSLYTGAITTIGSSVGSLITTTAIIYEGTLFINNLISFLDQKQSITPSINPPAQVQRHMEHTVVFENVSFSYPGTKRDVLKNVNLTINAGETIVIVGLNGAGKTTLVKLLTRLYDPTTGRILLDGHDIKEYDVEQLYELYGIIFQDFGKYAVSIGENISFGEVRKAPSLDEIAAAAQQSGADEFIEKLPGKYDTPLMRYFEENGLELSIGQWQKLAIARAFYSDSDILILDEPTASLDPMAEQAIFNQFNTLRKGKMSIFISHRLSSATIADKILVMEDGQIIETGNHAKLMSQKGRYFELFTTQAERYKVS